MSTAGSSTLPVRAVMKTTRPLGARGPATCLVGWDGGCRRLPAGPTWHDRVDRRNGLSGNSVRPGSRAGTAAFGSVPTRASMSSNRARLFRCGPAPVSQPVSIHLIHEDRAGRVGGDRDARIVLDRRTRCPSSGHGRGIAGRLGHRLHEDERGVVGSAPPRLALWRNGNSSRWRASAVRCGRPSCNCWRTTRSSCGSRRTKV